MRVSKPRLPLRLAALATNERMQRLLEHAAVETLMVGREMDDADVQDFPDAIVRLRGNLSLRVGEALAGRLSLPLGKVLDWEAVGALPRDEDMQAARAEIKAARETLAVLDRDIADAIPHERVIPFSTAKEAVDLLRQLEENDDDILRIIALKWLVNTMMKIMPAEDTRRNIELVFGDHVPDTEMPEKVLRTRFNWIDRVPRATAVSEDMRSVASMNEIVDSMRAKAAAEREKIIMDMDTLLSTQDMQAVVQAQGLVGMQPNDILGTLAQRQAETVGVPFARAVKLADEMRPRVALRLAHAQETLEQLQADLRRWGVGWTKPVPFVAQFQTMYDDIKAYIDKHAGAGRLDRMLFHPASQEAIVNVMYWSEIVRTSGAPRQYMAKFSREQADANVFDAYNTLLNQAKSFAG